jgi:Fe-S cluster assembly protein SufD
MTMSAAQTFNLPTSRDENWKYANLRALERVSFVAAPQRSLAIDPAALPARIQGYARYTFVDGILAPALSTSLSQTGIAVESLRPVARAMPGEQSNPDMRFALLNDAFATDGLRITAAADANCTACIEVVFVATADAQTAASYPRVELEAGPRARLGLIERHVSLENDANFVNGAVLVNIAPAARVDHFRLQQAGARANWVDTVVARVASDSVYQLYSINLGAASARSTMHVTLAGERAEFGLHCVSVADHRQVHDGFALVEHAAPGTRSRQSFRGIGSGRSRVAFNSKVVVREAARGTDSYQSLRGLLAGTDAEIDVRPQLEIYTDDVRCAHGATTGKLDEAMLFYMLSRGLEAETAQRLLKWAFLEDVVAKIEVPELRRQIERSLAGQLKETAVLEELF